MHRRGPRAPGESGGGRAGAADGPVAAGRPGRPGGDGSPGGGAGADGAGELRRSGRQTPALGGQYLHHPDPRRPGRGRNAPASARFAVRGILPRVLRTQPPAPAPAQGHLPGIGVHRRCRRLHRDQQPRHPGRRRDHGRPSGRHPARGGGRGARSQDRHRRTQGEADAQADGRALRGFGQGAGRGLGGRHRQPLRPGRQRDRRHHLGPQPRYQLRPLRRLHPDRRLDQPRQFGRPDVQPRRRGHRHRHGHLLTVGGQRRHRLRHPQRHRPRSSSS